MTRTDFQQSVSIAKQFEAGFSCYATLCRCEPSASDASLKLSILKDA